MKTHGRLWTVTTGKAAPKQDLPHRRPSGCKNANSLEGRENAFPEMSVSRVPCWNRIASRNVLGSARLALKVTGGMATSQTGSRIDIVLMMLVLQATESKSY